MLLSRPRAADLPYFDAAFLAIAHRGGYASAEDAGRENSRYAFTSATGLGYRYLETDVHATADGVLIAFHDDRLDRVTDSRGLIAELPWEIVAQARIAGIDPIPTLAELLEAFPEARFNIDAKADGAVQLLVDTIADHDSWQRVCVSSFGVGRLHRLRRLLRRRLGSTRPVATAASQAGIAWGRFVPVLPYAVGTPAQAFQLPARWPVLGAERELVTERLVALAHNAGQQVHVWTVNEAAEMNRLIDLGVDGLISDRIDTLKQVLTERGLWG